MLGSQVPIYQSQPGLRFPPDRRVGRTDGAQGGQEWAGLLLLSPAKLSSFTSSGSRRSVSSLQARCPSHTLKLDAAPPRETVVGTHTLAARPGNAKDAVSPEPPGEALEEGAGCDRAGPSLGSNPLWIRKPGHFQPLGQKEADPRAIPMGMFIKHAEERSGVLILVLLPKCSALKMCKVRLYGRLDHVTTKDSGSAYYCFIG